jgi:hypothetical protein
VLVPSASALAGDRLEERRRRRAEGLGDSDWSAAGGSGWSPASLDLFKKESHSDS